ncbi:MULTISPECIES: hypothetical protein [Streptomyces]|nr:hypothetical protein [Streptomyces indiaensis]
MTDASEELESDSVPDGKTGAEPPIGEPFQELTPCAGSVDG